MTQTEFAIHYHWLQFRLACHEQRGSAFQSFFEKIMQKHDHTFLPIKPSGREGDWKCDGFSQTNGTVYQCYAPEEMTDAKAAAKIKIDFNGAKQKWQFEMKRWVFVWSAHEALPPQAGKALQELKANNSSIEINAWGREALWNIVAELSDEDRVELLRPVPRLDAVTETTAAEVQTLLNYLVRQNIKMVTDDLALTDLADKIDRNRLSENVRVMVRTALPVARMVEDYTGKHPDIDFSLTIASSLAEKYKTLATTNDEAPDTIFGNLVKYVSQDQMEQPKIFWAAVGIVTHYFQLCDIFER